MEARGSSIWRSLVLIGTLGLGLVFASVAIGEATRTWVSGVGDDANPCSRTAPCKTFAGAISKTAVGGEIDVLDPGGFGALTITKSITIDGSGGSTAGVLVSGTNGIVVDDGGAGTAVVTLRNLDFDGLGSSLDGIKINSAKSVKIENDLIYGFTNGVEWNTSSTGGRLFVSHSDIHDNSGRGISWNNTASGKLFVEDTKVESNGQRGIFFQPSAPGGQLTVSNTKLDDDSAGISVDGTTGPATAALSNDTISGNTGNGIVGLGGAKVAVMSSTVMDNPVNGISSTGSSIYVCGSLITGNGTGVTGSSTLSCGNNLLDGNGTNGSFTGSAHFA